MRKRRRGDKGGRVVFTPYITIGGRRIYARDYGLKVFRFVVYDA